MKRVFENQDWTLFSPDEVPDLHDLYGDAFEKAYVDMKQRPRVVTYAQKLFPLLNYGAKC